MATKINHTPSIPITLMSAGCHTKDNMRSNNAPRTGDFYSRETLNTSYLVIMVCLENITCKETTVIFLIRTAVERGWLECVEEIIKTRRNLRRTVMEHGWNCLQNTLREFTWDKCDKLQEDSHACLLFTINCYSRWKLARDFWWLIENCGSKFSKTCYCFEPV